MKNLLGIIIVAFGMFNISYSLDSRPIRVGEEFKVKLPALQSPYILHASFLANNEILFVCAGSSVSERLAYGTYINIVTLNLKGQMVRSHKFRINDAWDLCAFSEEGDVTLGWHEMGIMRDHISRLWMSKLHGDKLQKRLLLEEKKDGEINTKDASELLGIDLEPTLSGSFWLLRVGQTQKLFVTKRRYKWVRSKGEPDLSEKEWLYCYVLDNSTLTLEGKARIRGDIKCSVDGNEVLIWQIVPEKADMTETLRMAIWKKGGKLKWTNCYTGNTPIHFWVDSSHGSAVLICEKKSPAAPPGGILYMLRATTTDPVPMCSCFWGGGIDGQLLRVSDKKLAWVAAYTAMTANKIVIIRVDKELHAVSDVLPKPLEIRDHHLIYHQGDLYLAMTSENKLIVRKIVDTKT